MDDGVNIYMFTCIYTMWSARQKAATSKKPQQTNNNQQSHMARKKCEGTGSWARGRWPEICARGGQWEAVGGGGGNTTQQT